MADPANDMAGTSHVPRTSPARGARSGVFSPGRVHQIAATTRAPAAAHMPDRNATDLFLGLTPDAVLNAIEATGLRCTNACHALNSFENRVYEVELADEARTRRVAKFYRPERWTAAQIREEHAFLAALADDEVPVCNVLALGDGDTVASAGHILFCLFERWGGRAPEEIDDELAGRLGALAARIHNVGARLDIKHRRRLDADRTLEALEWLLSGTLIPTPLRDRYGRAARALVDLLRARLEGVDLQPIHGDLHAGNLILREGVLHVLDFDDMVIGPPVQDLWLLLPGRDVDSRRRRALFLEGYERFRAFDRRTLNLIEPLRGLRFVTYSAWLARRWHDPIFPLTWPQFGGESWWRDAVDDLEDALAHVDTAALGEVAEEVAVGLDDKDYFWDM